MFRERFHDLILGPPGASPYFPHAFRISQPMSNTMMHIMMANFSLARSHANAYLQGLGMLNRFKYTLRIGFASSALGQWCRESPELCTVISNSMVLVSRITKTAHSIGLCRPGRAETFRRPTLMTCRHHIRKQH